MGHQLWVSPVTGCRRKGTRFSALREIFVENITARSIYEPLLCCPADARAEEVGRALTLRGFDVAGVRDSASNEVIGYILTDELGDGRIQEYVQPVTTDLLVSDSTAIAEIFSVLTNREFAFVLSGQQIAGIITKADINKPPVRIYLFGMTSLFEMHLNAWVHHFYSQERWLEKVPEQRMEAATRIYDVKKEKNQELSMLECLQLCDKRDLLAKSDTFRAEFAVSKKGFDSFVKGVERVRNELAHSQYSIVANIAWSDLIKVVEQTELFLINSDDTIERLAAEGNEFQDVLTPGV